MTETAFEIDQTLEFYSVENAKLQELRDTIARSDELLRSAGLRKRRTKQTILESTVNSPDSVIPEKQRVVDLIENPIALKTDAEKAIKNRFPEYNRKNTTKVQLLVDKAWRVKAGIYVCGG